MKKKKIVVFGIIISIILCFSGYWFLLRPVLNKSEEDNREADFLTVIKERKSGIVYVTGNIQPCKEKKLKFPQMGVIGEIFVSEGDEVKKGTVLAVQEADDLILELDRKDLEIRKCELAGYTREVSILKREKANLIKDKEQRILTAPFDGVILNVNQDEGDLFRVETSDGYVIHMVDMSSLKSKVEVDELDIPYVKKGQQVEFVFDALQDCTYFGSVEKLAPIGRVGDSGITVRDIELILPDPDDALFVPYSFTASIRVFSESDLLLIDETAVIYKNDKVFLSPLESPEKLRVVSIEFYGQGMVRILSGAEEGEFFLRAPWAGDQKDIM